jgi:ankyrin repeat protein
MNKEKLEELKKLLTNNTASIYARLVAIKKLYPKEYNEFNLELDINSRNVIGETALMQASYYGHYEVVKLLIELGTDVNAIDSFGRTALMVVVSGNKLSNRCIKIVKLLLEAGAKVNIKDNWGNTALLYASSDGYAAVVKLLLEAGADVNIKDVEGYTALEWARRMKRRATVKLLRQHIDKRKEVKSYERSYKDFKSERS